jgi:transcriptional regulator with XRE-family HTH domain
MSITASQVQEARKLLGWTRDRLAGASGLSPAIIAHLENGRRSATAPRLLSIRCVLEDFGIIFVEVNGEGSGVRLRKSRPAIGDEDALPKVPSHMMARRSEAGEQAHILVDDILERLNLRARPWGVTLKIKL